MPCRQVSKKECGVGAGGRWLYEIEFNGWNDSGNLR